MSLSCLFNAVEYIYLLLFVLSLVTTFELWPMLFDTKRIKGKVGEFFFTLHPFYVCKPGNELQFKLFGNALNLILGDLQFVSPVKLV